MEVIRSWLTSKKRRGITPRLPSLRYMIRYNFGARIAAGAERVIPALGELTVTLPEGLTVTSNAL